MFERIIEGLKEDIELFKSIERDEKAIWINFLWDNRRQVIVMLAVLLFVSWIT